MMHAKLLPFELRETLPQMDARPTRRPLFRRLAASTLEGGYRAPSGDTGEALPLHLNENLLELHGVGALPLPVVDAEELARYPRLGERPLRTAAAAEWGLDPDQIVTGLGSSALINTVVAAFSNCGATALLPTPTWSYYYDLLRGCGVTVEEVAMRGPEEGFAFDVQALLHSIRQSSPDLVVLTSPNNPTGRSLAYEELLRLAEAAPQSLFVFDEAYYGFTEDDPIAVSEALRRAPNVLFLRTLSKAYGLAGLRVGFAFGGTEALALLRRQPTPFGISTLVQDIAVARLRQRGYLAAVRAAQRASHRALSTALGESDAFTVFESASNFVLVRVNHGSATEVTRRLRGAGIVVKQMKSAPLRGFLRITLASPEVMRRVARVMSGATKRLSHPHGAMR